MGRDQHHHIGADQADRWRKNARKRRWRWRPEYLCALALVPLAAFFAFNSDTLGIVGGLMLEKIEYVTISGSNIKITSGSILNALLLNLNGASQFFNELEQARSRRLETMRHNRV